MKKFKIFTVLTIFLNLMVVIGAGHGIGILAIVESFGLAEIFNGNVHITFVGTYDERLYTSALISLFAQVFLLTIIFIKNDLLKLYSILFLLPVLLLSFIILTLEFTHSNVDKISFISGIPFLISAFYTFFLAITQIGIRKGN